MKALETAGLGLGLGAGALLEGGVEATALARTLGWCDGAAVGLGVTASVLNEHRGWILSHFGEEGRAFLRGADRVNSVAALYGMARVMMALPKLLLGLRTNARKLLARSEALEGLTPEEVERLKGLKGPLDDFFRKVDEVQARRAGGGGPRGSDASAQVGAKVISLDSARTPGKTPGHGAQPRPAQEESLVATGTDGRLVPIRRQAPPGNSPTVAIRKPSQGKGVEQHPSAPPTGTPTPFASTSLQPPGTGKRSAQQPTRKQAPRLTVLPGGLAVQELSTEEYAALKLAELEWESTRRLPGTTAELNLIRPNKEHPPLDVAADDPYWEKYVDYFDKRLAELDAHDNGRLATRSENPTPWKDFEFFKRNVERGLELENRFVGALEGEQALPMEQRTLTKGMRDPHINRRVGILRDNNKNVFYVDQLVTDLDSLARGKPLVECFSNKSHNFKYMSAGEIRAIVLKDLKELQEKYSGLIQIRRPGHPLFGQTVDVSKLHLVYDVDMTGAKADIIRAALEGAPVELHFR